MVRRRGAAQDVIDIPGGHGLGDAPVGHGARLVEPLDKARHAASAGEARIEPRQIGQADPQAPQADGEPRGAIVRHGDFSSRIAQTRQKGRGADLVQEGDGGNIEGVLQGHTRRHLPLKGQIEILRGIEAEPRPPILQHGLGMGDPGLEGEQIDEGFQSRARRAHRQRQIDAARPLARQIVRAAHMGAHLTAGVVDGDHGDGELRPQPRHAVAGQRLQSGLQPRVEGVALHPQARRGAQARLGGVGRQHGEGGADLRHRVRLRRLDLGLAQGALGHGAVQHPVAGAPRCVGRPVGTARLRRLRQRDQQGGLRVAQAPGLLAEIGEARGPHPLQIAPIWRQRQIEAEDLVLAIGALQLHRAHHLAKLGGQRALVARLQQTRHLHGERGGAGDHMAAARHLPGGPRHGEGIDPVMGAEPAVLISHEQFEEAWVYVPDLHR